MKEETLHFAGISFMASNLRSLFEPASGTLLLADCHFGKTTHFRKNNYPLPQTAALADFRNLNFLLTAYKPVHCIILGDLFHSASNAEWHWLSLLLKEHGNIHFTLIQGNHDILSVTEYEKAGFEVLESMILLEKAVLTHEPQLNPDFPNICGHIHPGFTISGRARQHITLPCFYIVENQMIMPSFGQLTGHINMEMRLPNGNALCFTKEELFWVTAKKK